jgi:4-amino-4-deoxy-L-arabinose transferase-like glycosyltransferase
MGAVAIAMAYATVIFFTGGFTVQIAGLRVRSHSWERPVLVAIAAGAVAMLMARSRVAVAWAHAACAIASQRFATGLALVAAASALAAGIVFGTFAVGGADSSGYAAQARLFGHGRLTDTILLESTFDWPDAAATLTPLGFTAGTTAGVIAPLYPPGLPLLLSPLVTFGSAMFLVVPLFGALLVWCTYRLGASIADPHTGAVAAVLIAASPTFLYQVVQPLSDVPAAACWLAAVLAAMRATAAGAAASGAICSLAILIRPNLAPLAAIVAIATIVSAPAGRIRRALSFAALVVPGLLVLGWIQQARYGSPFASGYGTLSDAFSIDNILPNLSRYPRWLTDTHTPLIWLTLAAPVWIVRGARRRSVAWIALALAAATWLAYLPYAYFHPNEWHYTRFLLLAIAIMLIFASAIGASVLRLVPQSWRIAAAAALVIGLAVGLLHAAASHGAFTIRNQEQRYPRAGAFVRDRLPASAFVIAAQHSGSIRYYAGRPILRWDVLAPDRLDDVVAKLRARGFEPYLVADTEEVNLFRNRFMPAHQRSAAQLTPLAVLDDVQVLGFR